MRYSKKSLTLFTLAFGNSQEFTTFAWLFAFSLALQIFCSETHDADFLWQSHFTLLAKKRSFHLAVQESTPYQSTLSNLKDKILGIRHHQGFPSGDLNISQNWHDISGHRHKQPRNIIS